MMAYLSILMAVLLFSVLLVAIVRARQEGAAGAVDYDEIPVPDGGADDALAAQMLARVFSAGDEAFVAGEASAGLERLLRRERKRLALRWVGRKDAEARWIMGQHARLARSARDLEPAGELRLALRYLELRSLCALLFLLISAFGPAGLHGLAAETNAVLSGIRTLGETAAESPAAG